MHPCTSQSVRWYPDRGWMYPSHSLTRQGVAVPISLFIPTGGGCTHLTLYPDRGWMYPSHSLTRNPKCSNANPALTYTLTLTLTPAITVHVSVLRCHQQHQSSCASLPRGSTAGGHAEPGHAEPGHAEPGHALASSSSRDGSAAPNPNPNLQLIPRRLGSQLSRHVDLLHLKVGQAVLCRLICRAPIRLGVDQARGGSSKARN